ncbi:MAG: amidohydrolase family protein, partial [Deltaproteobacteria bacterium]|nr:amidohydrolase family protein [Deltaproteobacteria bacterium]
AHIEELIWEYSEFDRGRYFESEGEWMTYVIRETFYALEPYLALTPRERDRKLDAMVAPVVNKFNGLDIPVCTTLVVDDVIVQKLFERDLFLQRPEIRYMPKGYRERLLAGNEKHQRQFKGGELFAPFKYALDKKLLTGLKSMGLPLLLSTDAGTGGMGIVPGFSLHDELEILVENGFTPYEAIAAGTSLASQVVGRMNGQDDFGTILPGKRADLLLLEQNPLENVAHTRMISGVMAAGRWYDRKALAEFLKKR